MRRALKHFTFHFLEELRMLRIMYSDLRRAMIDRSVKTGVLISLVYPILLYVTYLVIFKIAEFDTPVYGDELISLYVGISAFILSSIITGFVSREYTDGIIRNKIATGATRTAVFSSAAATSAVVAAVLSAISSAVIMILTFVFTPGFQNYSTKEIGDYLLIMTLAEMSIAVFAAMLVMAFGNFKIALALPLGIAFLMKVLCGIVADKLYPQDGPCLLTGTRLQVYSFIDKYIPYSYVERPMPYGFFTLFMGVMGLTVISMVVGLLIFNKKDIV